MENKRKKEENKNVHHGENQRQEDSSCSPYYNSDNGNLDDNNISPPEVDASRTEIASNDDEAEEWPRNNLSDEKTVEKHNHEVHDLDKVEDGTSTDNSIAQGQDSVVAIPLALSNSSNRSKNRQRVRFQDPVEDVIPAHFSKYCMSYAQRLGIEKTLAYRIRKWVRSKANAIAASACSKRIRGYFTQTSVKFSSFRTEFGLEKGSSSSMLYTNSIEGVTTPAFNSIENIPASSRNADINTKSRIPKKPSFISIFRWSKEKQFPNKIIPTSPKASSSSQELDVNVNPLDVSQKPSSSDVPDPSNRKLKPSETKSLFPDSL